MSFFILAISFLIYLFVIDDLIEFIVKYIVGENIFYHVVILLIRTTIFYWIGAFTSLSQTVRATTAAGVAVIILIIESLYRLREKQKE